MTLLELRNLTVSFTGRLLFEPLSLSLCPGEIVGIIGRSGVGKTSLLGAASGHLAEEYCRGEVHRLGTVARVFQEDRLFPWCDLLTNALSLIDVDRSPTLNEINYARDLLGAVGLRGAMHYTPERVSGGMKQRASIVRALVTGAPILMLDEPFASLDFDTKIATQKVLIGEVQRHQIGVMLVTHDIDDAVALSSRVLAIRSAPQPISNIDIDRSILGRDPLQCRERQDFFELVRSVRDAIR